MGLLGHMIGGALQGVGQGITNTAIARRNEALEAMRARNQMERDEANDRRQSERDKVKFDQQKELATLGYQHDVGKLAVGGKIQSDRDAAQHGYTMEEIKGRGLQSQELARLESKLASARTKEEIELRNKLESGEIKSVVRGADGTYYGVTNKGLVATGVAAAAETSASATSLTEGQIEAIYQDKRRAWLKGGKQGPEPTRSEVIAEAKTAPGALLRTQPLPNETKAKNTYTMAEYQATLADAGTRAARGDPRFKGKSPAEIKRMIDENFRAAGMKLAPNG